MLGGGDDIQISFHTNGGDGCVGVGFTAFGNLFNDILDNCKKGNFEEAKRL